MELVNDGQRKPNLALAALVEESGESYKALARRLNELARERGIARSYTHTSLTNCWISKGMMPRPPAPELLAQALGEAIGRTVTLAEMGMKGADSPAAEAGSEFPRDPADAVGTATSFWSTVNRRDLLTKSFAIAAFSTPTIRWLTAADQAHTHSDRSGRRVGRADVASLWAASEDARRWDARHGGGQWQNSSVVDCLRKQATPLLNASYTEDVGRDLFTATTELARVAGWAAFDSGHHAMAQRFFVQALSLARAAANLEAGGYVLATMALQSLIRGYPSEAVDMAQAAFAKCRHEAAPRVLAYIKVAEARAHGKLCDGPSAARALVAAEKLLGSIGPGVRDPEWVQYFTHARLSADAAEIYRDLGQPQSAFAWHRQAAAMPEGVFTRAVGIRFTIVGSAHVQAGDLDQGLAVSRHAVDILSRVHSARARDHVRDLMATMEPWRTDRRVAEFRIEASRMLRTAA